MIFSAFRNEKKRSKRRVHALNLLQFRRIINSLQIHLVDDLKEISSPYISPSLYNVLKNMASLILNQLISIQSKINNILKKFFLITFQFQAHNEQTDVTKI
jgi:hypothetical protein